MNQHAKYSPSKLARIIACPGSVNLAADMPEPPSSPYADEGTEAHRLANRALEGHRDTLPPEMAHAVKIFVDHCITLPAGQSEINLQSTTLSEFGGTLDHLAIDAENSHAYISDFKYGAGVPVIAEKNAQLLGYAVLVLEANPEIETFTLAIVQPRTAGDPIDSWTCGKKDVLAFRQQIIDAQSKTDLCPGNHCRWCPAMTICKPLAEKTLEIARLEFDDVNSRLFDIYQITPAIKSLLDSIPGKMISAMQQGQKFPGLKAVQAFGNRDWPDDDVTTLRKLAKEKIGKKIATVAKLKTPAQLEREGYGEIVAALAVRPERGIALVPESDKRAALNFDTVEETFEDLSFLN